MPDPPAGGFHLPPKRARFARQAAALLLHWMAEEDATEGVMEILRDIHGADEWTDLVCALLSVASVAFVAARDGREVEYLRSVVTQGALDEMGGDE